MLVAATVVGSVLLAPVPANAYEASMSTGMAAEEPGLARVFADAAATHFLGIRTDGTVWAWGENGSGQLGDGTAVDRAAPVQIPSLTGARDIALGADFSLALMADGTVRSWGANASGQLGIGTTTPRLAPAAGPAFGGVEAWQISAGGGHAAAILSDGTVWTWGANANGQLGDATTTQRTSPVQIASLAGARTVELGEFHSAAIKSDGTVWLWGLNSNGQLGDASTTQRTAPVQVASIAGARLIALGAAHSGVIKADGTVWMWGRNADGELGDGTTTQRTAPVQVAAVAGSRTLDLGAHHSGVIESDGTVQVWGDNALGSVGDGTTTDRTAPTTIASLAGARQLVLASGTSFATTSTGVVRAWGDNASGQLADGTTTQRSAPVTSQFSLGLGFLKVYAYADFSMAIRADGTVWAWGDNTWGQLGDGTTTNRNSAVQIASLTGARELTLGHRSAFAIKADGTVWAWGDNAGGNLGDGTWTAQHSPIAIPALDGARKIAAGEYHCVAVMANGAVMSWGNNTVGQIGRGGGWQTPGAVVSSAGAREVWAGWQSSMAILSTGAVQTWGNNAQGQLGDGTTTDQAAPNTVAALNGARQLTMFFRHAGARMANGQVRMWGENNAGQVGDGSATNRSSPVVIASMAGAVDVQTGNAHSVATQADGSVWSWGYNPSYNLGDNTTNNRSSPVAAVNVTNVNRLMIGASHGIFWQTNGTLRGWAQNTSGQLGDCSFTNRQTAVLVMAPGCVQFPQPPSPPTAGSFGQFAANGVTPIAAGAWTRDGVATNIVIKFTASDPQASQTLTPWVEVRPVGTPFSATCGTAVAGVTFGGAAVGAPVANTQYNMVVNVSTLASNAGYVWRACVVDQGGATTMWSAYGNSPDFRVDRTVPTAPAQTSIFDLDVAAVSDATWTGNATALSVGWGAGSDVAGGSGVANYDACFSTVNAGCTLIPGTAIAAGAASSAVATASPAMSNGSTYYTCVRANDVAGNVSGWTCSNGFTVDTTAPANPTQAGIFDLSVTFGGDVDATSNQTALSASWNASASPDVADYSVCFSTAAASCTNIPGTSTVAGNTVRTAVATASPAMSNGTTYYVCVRARDNAGNQPAGWQCSDGFTVDTVAPVNPVQADVFDLSGAFSGDVDATSNQTSLSGSWNASVSPDVADYSVCFSTVATGCTNIPGTSTVVGNTTRTAVGTASPAMTNGSTYYVCVRARDNAGNQPAGWQCSDGFTVDTSAPANPTQAGIFDLSVTFGNDLDTTADPTSLSASWNASASVDVVDYSACFSTISGGCTNIPGTSTVTGNTTRTAVATASPGMVTGSTYYVCVRARDAVGNQPAWQCSDGFTIGATITVSVQGYDASGAGPTPGAASFGSIGPSATAEWEARVTVATDSPGGYALAARDTGGYAGPLGSGTDTIPPISVGSVAAPAPWSGVGMGISVFDGASSPARWCTGGQVACTGLGDPDLRYAPLTSVDQQITGFAAPTVGDTTRVAMRLVVPPGQAAGTYDGETTFTVTALP